MSLKENDFIEIEFTGKTKDGEIFDSNIKSDLETLHAGHDHPIDVKPFVFCLGKGMFLKAVDDFLIGKPEKGSEYTLDLEPEKAFGRRHQELIQRMPSQIFKEHKVNPVPGFTFNFDGRAGKILSVSGGRVMVDFNHALAGKPVEYKIKLKRKVEDLNEKVVALNDFFFRREIKFDVQGSKIVLYIPKEHGLKQLAELLKDKYKELLGLEAEIKDAEEEKEEGDKNEKKSETAY